MVLVRVHRVSSVRDPETGRYGKMIELIEEKRVQAAPRVSGPPETLMIQSMLQDLTSYFQSMGLMLAPPIKTKMILLLTEEEYEMLGVKLDVNEVYELVFEKGAIRFKSAYD
ncbi:MAG: arcadin 1 [Nitrososphaerota archaeon]